MTRIWKRTGLATTVAVLTAASVLMVGGVAHADTIQDTIADTGAGVTLVAGSSVAGNAGIRLIGNSAQQDPDPGCNIDAGDAPLVLNVVTPAGVTATPNPVAITGCGTDFAVGFTATATAVSGAVTVTVTSGPAGGGTYVNQVSIPITITQPAPTNTKPTAIVGGVTTGAVYEIGAVPSATCVITDAEDGVAAAASPALTGTLTDGLGTQTATCDYTDKGGLAATTATASYSIVDTGDPTITHTLAGSVGLNGWYTSNVGVDFDCDDAGGSGIASCDGDTTLIDGANQSVTGTATDRAGNTATDTTAGISIDTIDPTITPTVADATGTGGWYNADVAVGFSCDDAGGSGIQSCSGDTTLTDGRNQSVTGTAIDVAGNTAVGVVSGINVDTIAPSISADLTADAPDGDNGWYVTEVVVGFVCEDSGSGVGSCAGGTTLGEGEAQSVTGTATDVAGNTASVVSKAVNIDLSAPTTPVFAGGPSGSHYYGSTPAAPTCEASDALSGLASCTVTGGGSGVGEQSYTATATDVAGNVSTATLNYTVLAWTLNGFYSPVDMGGVWNTVKGGSTVPLKFEIFAGTERTDVSAVKSFTTTQVSCPGSSATTDAIELTTTGGTVLRYDSTGGQFVQNWATPKKPGACIKVTMTAQDDSTIVANFILK